MLAGLFFFFFWSKIIFETENMSLFSLANLNFTEVCEKEAVCNQAAEDSGHFHICLALICGQETIPRKLP